MDYRLFQRRNRPAWLVLLISLSLAFMAWYYLREQTGNNARQQFELHVLDVLDSIETRMHQHQQILLGGVGLFDASDLVTREDWHAYVGRLNLGKLYPGIQGVGFSKLIQPENLPAHIASIRAQGFPDYTVRPPGARDPYTAIVYLEPFSGRNMAAFGFDMMSEPTRARAMRAAVNENRATITNKVKLVQETHGKQQAGLLMYLPVYRKGQPLATAEERWAALEGFVYSPYRMDDLMSGILGNRALMLDFSIFDGTTEAEDARLFNSQDEPRAEPAMMSTSRTIDLYGKPWTIRLHSSPEFEASIHKSEYTVIPVLGCGISVLFFMLVSFLISRREYAEKMALGMTADIRANEHKLRQSEAQIHAILEGAEHLIISTDINGLIQSFNGSAERHLGYRAEEVIGVSTPALFHDINEVAARAQELTASGIPVEPGFEVMVAEARKRGVDEAREWTYIRKDGSKFKVSLIVTAIYDETGAINAFLGIATDITAQVLARQLHQDDETRIAAILDNVLDGIVTINERGDIESFNKAAEQIFGHAQAEVMGNNVKMLMPDPYRSEHDTYLNNFVTTGRKKIIGMTRQVTGMRKDGSTFPMDLAVSELKLGSKLLFTGIVRDITERVKVERMKSEFISTVSHELRTPLTSIRGSLALILGGVVGELPATAKPLIDIANKNTERLILLVNDILDMEKIEAGKMEFEIQQVKLMPLLQQALEGNRAYAEQFKVSYELDSELPDAMVSVDPNRLMQVFANLLSNAAKFSPAGGKVTVSVTRIGSRIRVAVNDNGPGIPDDFKGSIFQKFAQADSSDTRKKGGTGLGLSITKAIIEQMGGSIGFDSEPDVLTTFYFEFPEWLQELQTAPTSFELTEDQGQAPRSRALYVEDDTDLFQVIKGLAGEVVALDQAPNLAEARRLLQQQTYDLLILDIILPDGSGLDLLPLLEAARPRIPVLLFSAIEVNAEDAQKVDAVMVKSRSNNEQLLAAIKRLLGTP